jgi:hypothetical protein
MKKGRTPFGIYQHHRPDQVHNAARHKRRTADGARRRRQRRARRAFGRPAPRFSENQAVELKSGLHTGQVARPTWIEITPPRLLLPRALEELRALATRPHARRERARGPAAAPRPARKSRRSAPTGKFPSTRLTTSSTRSSRCAAVRAATTTRKRIHRQHERRDHAHERQLHPTDAHDPLLSSQRRPHFSVSPSKLCDIYRELSASLLGWWCCSVARVPHRDGVRRRLVSTTRRPGCHRRELCACVPSRRPPRRREHRS